MTAAASPAGRRAPAPVAIVTACLLVGAGCGSSGTGAASSDAPRGSTARLTTSNAGSSAGASLEGTWQTGSVSVEQMVSTLRDAGLQKWIQPFRAKAGMGDSNVFRLMIADGYWREEYSRDGGPFEDFDDASYRVAGGTVALTRGAGSYHWQVTGDTLRLTFVPHSMAGSDPVTGISGEALQRAFYTSAPFHRRP